MHGLGPDNMSHDQYRHMLDVHEIYHDDLNHYTKKDNCKEVWISKYRPFLECCEPREFTRF